MKSSITIRNYQLSSHVNGYALVVNGCAISKDAKAIVCEHGSIPYGAACFVSVQALRNFWNKYRITVCYNTAHKQNKSVWGQLVPLA